MRTLLICALLALSASLRAADTAPDWVKEQSSRPLPAYGPEVHSVMLLDEAHTTVDASGQRESHLRQAIRIVTVEGRSDAVAAIEYMKGAGKIRDFHAWLISPSGFVKTYGKESFIDRAPQESFALYEDYRMRLIQARNPEIGSTFAWSADLGQSSFIPQDEWFFQDHQPVLLSRYVLTVPDGWSAKGTTFNHAPITPLVEGNTYTWQLENLPLIKNEPASPRLASLAPKLGITLTPAAGSASLPKVDTWRDVSVWNAALADSQADANDALAAKVKELTTSASSDYQRMQAISHYVQNVKYVAIEINLARGGGYQPHLASDVFAKQYGDCKDKANLMRAMLKCAGIRSYLVSVYSGDRYHVNPQWPSPYQFNHEIIAVQVDNSVAGPVVLVHSALGRLLFFDPTDTGTPLGDLPDDEQGSYALIIAGQKGDIVQLPSAPPESNRSDIIIAGKLSDRGALEVNFEDHATGQSAAELRRIYAAYQRADFQKQLEGWLSESVKQVNLMEWNVNDAFQSERLSLKIAFQSANYAQLMQGRMLIFRPGIVERWNGIRIQTGARSTPVTLDSECYHKQVRVKLPAGFTVDEMPDAADLTAPFGKFTSTYKVENGELLFTEQLDVSAATIPANRYGEVKDFFEHVAGAEQAPLVLIKN